MISLILYVSQFRTVSGRYSRFPLGTSVGGFPFQNGPLSAERTPATDDGIAFGQGWSSRFFLRFRGRTRFRSRFRGGFWSGLAGPFLRSLRDFLGFRDGDRLVFYHRHPAVAVVAQYAIDDFRNHLLQLGEEGTCIVTLPFDFTQFLFPDTGQFGRFQQFFVDKLNQLHSGGGSYQVFPFLADVMTFEQGFDDGGTGRRASDSVFFHRIAEFVVVYQFSGVSMARSRVASV